MVFPTSDVDKGDYLWSPKINAERGQSQKPLIDFFLSSFVFKIDSRTTRRTFCTRMSNPGEGTNESADSCDYQHGVTPRQHFRNGHMLHINLVDFNMPVTVAEPQLLPVCKKRRCMDLCMRLQFNMHACKIYIFLVAQCCFTQSQPTWHYPRLLSSVLGVYAMRSVAPCSLYCQEFKCNKWKWLHFRGLLLKWRTCRFSNGFDFSITICRLLTLECTLSRVEDPFASDDENRARLFAAIAKILNEKRFLSVFVWA